MEEKKEMEFHFFCDTEEMGCGDLVIALMKAMKPLQMGEVLKIRALDSGAKADIPAWCNLAGHKLLKGPCGEDQSYYFIEKGKK